MIATFRVAESMGLKGEFRQWEELLRVGEYGDAPSAPPNKKIFELKAPSNTASANRAIVEYV